MRLRALVHSRQDGAAGLSQAAFDERARVCLSQGVEPDSTAYFQGRVQGLQVYCSPSNGYRLGLEGGEASNICPPGLREQFFAEFNRGRAERAQAGTGEWRTRVGGGVRIGVGSGGVRSGAGVSIGL